MIPLFKGKVGKLLGVCLALGFFITLTGLSLLYPNSALIDVVNENNGNKRPSSGSSNHPLFNGAFISLDNDRQIQFHEKHSKVIIFPRNMPYDTTDLAELYEGVFESKSANHFVKYEPRNKPEKSEKFRQHMLKTFNNQKTTKDCREIQDELSIEISDSRRFNDDIESIVEKFILSDSDYYKEIMPYFGKKIVEQFQKKTIRNHWFKFAGTSVWLEDYGVHYMISRIIYSSSGKRNHPDVSLTYAQIFNENWLEVKDVELIVPNKDIEILGDGMNINGDTYTRLEYPNFLSIPCFQDASKTKGRFYGTEDPRMLLVKDEKGYDQPLIIYNAYHRKLIKTIEANSTEEVMKDEFYRSMFMSWPWKFQKGKSNIDYSPDEATYSTIYNKAIELKREDIGRQPKEKNWTPFISYQDREIYQHDKFIYFVYKWSNLETLKCNLTNASGEYSNCVLDYKADNENKNQKVGPLRGGTEMINMNMLMQNSGKTSESLENKEVWIGFARAHIKKCGCNTGMYRPNLAVIVKDLMSNQYHIDLISSYTSLDMEMVGWNLKKPQDTCGGKSVLIPNGISSWSIDDIGGNNWIDRLTLTLSLSDATNDLIHIKGLLSSVLPKLSSNSNPNDNVRCAMESSKKFCKVFANKQSKDPKL
ncbi:beta-mannosyltransferase 5 [[Candida] jaroonii]|uniref:Beta-mannosyltransferase 5 n=1 Tax=[Candida] jaroonii TaxID=467808 RepID=A0ACA9YDT0_9ASCO|nr:beta-mannosyltransferase 5 [[Candida] jaroonii]